MAFVENVKTRNGSMPAVFPVELLVQTPLDQFRVDLHGGSGLCRRVLAPDLVAVLTTIGDLARLHGRPAAEPRRGRRLQDSASEIQVPRAWRCG